MTLKNELLLLSTYLLAIGLCNFLIRDFIYDKPDNWSFRYLWEEFRNTFLVGFLFLLFFLPINLERLLIKYKSAAKQLHIKGKYISSTAIDTSILIETPIEKEMFKLYLSEFVFAKVEGKYTEVYTITNGELKMKLVLIPLKNLEKQIKSFSIVFKTHRSYLVNTLFIESVKGNAQGYEITLVDSRLKVPVSRSKVANFNRFLSSK
ncbi:LytTR family DNA-binding domain-containing protein [uncultured Croceitalea sp.]|uniref:LytR/AlgR family response regulator transcription factor n=1 Tax=uncultured Croceitalea sp. TaxID=1798908 RepID=UPI003306458F